MVSWTAWSGHASVDESGRVSEDKSAAVGAPAHGRPSDEAKRRPVSRLWPSFSSIGRDRSAQRREPRPPSPSPPPPDEHIYEEIDDVKRPAPVALTRTGRGGSFAGASRADILRYLDELRKKQPNGAVSADGERKSPVTTPATPMTPSLPQLIAPADDDDDDDVGALLLAMRHNAPNRHSNRSTQSSTSSTQSSGQDSAVSASALSASSAYQVIRLSSDLQFAPRDKVCK